MGRDLRMSDDFLEIVLVLIKGNMLLIGRTG